MKKVTIINKFGPASNAVTGQNAKELADFLLEHNIEVNFVCIKAEYVATNKGSGEVLSFPVKEIRNLYSGRSAGLRLIFGLIDGFRLWLASLRGKADVVIVMTDPPLLILWFQLLRRFSRRKLCYWTMDLYPEAFVAGKYISASNFIYRLFHYIVYRRIPDLAIVLGKQQYDYLRGKFRSEFPYVVIPAGVLETDDKIARLGIHSGGKIRFGYSGNIGEAHDAEFLISLAKHLDPEKHEMIVRIYGSKAAHVTEMIQGNKSVQMRNYLDLAEIAAMDVNIVSLLPEWDHICVPSKAVTAICCGTSLLLNTTTEADNWKMFGGASWLVEAGNNLDAGLAGSLKGITRESIDAKRITARELAKSMVLEKKLALLKLVGIIQP